MSTPKTAAVNIIQDLPDSVTYDEILYHIYIRKGIEQGRLDVERGDVVSQEEVEQIMKRWIIE